jgi:hypothetical protein
MHVILLVIFICVSYLVVRIGAIALEMTGMDRSSARFQALSAFSGTGFTTKEAEQVVNHSLRRRIIIYLMILGNAGIVSVVATFVLSLNKSGFITPSLNLIIIAASLFVLYRIATHQRLARKAGEKVRRTLIEKLHFNAPLQEEILRQPGGYGVVSILIGSGSRLAGIALGESGFAERNVLVLSVERNERLIPFPKPDMIIETHDRLVCYGELKNISESV